MVPSRVIIEVLSTFNEQVAHAVRSAIVRGVDSITIDFTHAARVDGVSLARLARELARDERRAATVLGLSRDQERLVRYLGTRLPGRWALGPTAIA